MTFKRPPVVETVLGIQFERLSGLTNAHLGAFWHTRQASWPQVNDAPPLEEQFETFGEQSAWARALRLRLTQSPSARVQMRNETGDRMVQIQNCRLDYNWIARPQQDYPRYRTVRPEFDELLQAFAQFVGEHALGTLSPTQWEVTYVNHILKGTAWNEPQDWPEVIRSLPAMTSAPPETRLEGFGAHWHYEIEPRRGRLHVELQHAVVEQPEKREALVMKLTARGPIGEDEDPNEAIDQGLNLGHNVIVSAFRDLTSQQAHDYWNMENQYAER
ncbi:MAG: TIGR04255 family protein [Planctomycetes bacterium]|nr:TIGR04255 family protein [Planctomycetota bacterium]